MITVHPMTNIHPEAKVGNNVTIEAFTTISKDVIIGDNCWIGPNVCIMDGARIGNNCKIFPGAVIAGIPQDLKFQGEKSTVEIGDNTIIREYVTINRGTASSGKMQTIVGENCLIMSYVHIAHDCKLGNNVILVSYVGLAGEVEVDDFAIIGGSSVIHQFVRIGKHTMLSGGSLVGKDVPPYVRAARLPLSFSGINKIGLLRRRFTSKQVEDIHQCYRLLFQSGLNTTQACEQIEKEIMDSPEKRDILEFIRSSKRGLIKGYIGDDVEPEF